MNSIRAKLSVMMFLEFFIWGAWLPLIFGYLPSLGFTPIQQSWILNAFALASFVGMFFSNQFADRNFAAERFLAVSHLIGGVSILALAWVPKFWQGVITVVPMLTKVDSNGFALFFLLMLVHSLFYVPTISITNSIAFANLKDPQHDFGPVRLWGTIGWIAASLPFTFILVDWVKVPAFGTVSFVKWLGAALGTGKTGVALQEGTTYTFIAAGIASLILAAFSMTLPHTPPKPAKEGGEKFAWLEAMKLLRVPFLLVLFVVTFFDAAVHQCYFIWTNDFLQKVGIPANWVMPVMSIGQIAEIGTMAILGTFLKRLGWRYTMLIGILGHTVRFGVFALAPIPWLAVSVNLLHGVCYAFFFATVYIFVDEFFPKDARTSAQGLFNFLILGFGQFVANFVWPMVGDNVKTVDVTAAVVRTDNSPPTIVLKGLVKHGTPEAGSLTITQELEGRDPVVKTVPLTAEGEFTADFGAIPEQGSEVIHRFNVVRKEPLKGPVEGEVKLAPLVIGPAVPLQPEKSVSVKEWDFRKLFLWPSGTALFAALLLFIFFHPPLKSQPESMAPGSLSH